MLLVDDAGEVQVGTPFVEGARVVAEVIEQGRDTKILVFKYKNKTRYRRRHGHRQAYTRVAIREILTHGREAAKTDADKPTRAPRRRSAPEKKAERADVKPTLVAEAPPSTAAAEATAGTAAAKPRRPALPRKTSQPSTEAKPEAGEGTAAKSARRTRTKKTESEE